MGDGSSTNRPLLGKLVALRNNLRIFGFADTVRAVLAHFHLTSLASADRFDASHGVATDGEIDVEQSDIDGPSRPHAIKYQPTHEKVLAAVLAELPIAHEHFVFVDLGSGKGRVLVAAARYPYARIVGVELSERYCTAARANVDLAGADQVEVVCGDVAEWPLPDAPLVLYLFNPFDAPVLRCVLDRLTASLASHPREVWIAYCNAALGRELLEQAGCELISETPVIVPEWTWSLWRAHPPGPAHA